MDNKLKIENLIAEERAEEAIALATECMQQDADNALWPFLRGKAHWKMGQKGQAISDYELAVSLDPESPAKHALEISRSVMDFYNPDLLNP